MVEVDKDYSMELSQSLNIIRVFTKIYQNLVLLFYLQE